MAELYVPGDLLFEEPKRFSGGFVENNKTYASVICSKHDERVVPLKGKYIPLVQDYVVGIITEQRFNGYTVDLNSPYEGQLSSRESRETFRIGDVVSALIQNVDEVNEAQLVEPRRLWEGRLIEVESVKIPRIIGRNSSMVSLIENKTRCKLFVGKNGRIYMKEGNLPLAAMAILKISKEAHTSGLTDRIQEFLGAEETPSQKK